MPINLTVIFEPYVAPREPHPLDIMDTSKGMPGKFVARMCCNSAHLTMHGQDIVTCCHAGHPSFMIRDGNVVGTAA